MVELHLHLDGSLRVETALELALSQNADDTLSGLAPKDRLSYIETKMRVDDDCASLNDYLERFRLPLRLLQDKASITRAVFELGEDLLKDDVQTAEIRFAPYSFCGNGLTPEDAVAAAIDGAKQAMKAHDGLKLSLILCCMRGQEEAPFIGKVDAALTGPKANYRLLDLARDFLGDVVRGVDLAGAEALYPTEHYADLFAYARKLELPYTIHAGEGDGAKSVWAALKFPSARIGHGVRAIEDPLLVDELVKSKTTLECCLISNFHIRCFETRQAHPIRRLFDAGVRVTLNTDNRTISHTSMAREIETAQRMFGFSDRDIALMQDYAQEALF